MFPIRDRSELRELSQLLSKRAANSLKRVRIYTINDLLRVIEQRGLFDVGGGKSYYFGLLDDDFPQPRLLGPKRWEEILSLLEERGFDWQAHVLIRSKQGKFAKRESILALADTALEGEEEHICEATIYQITYIRLNDERDKVLYIMFLANASKDYSLADILALTEKQLRIEGLVDCEIKSIEDLGLGYTIYSVQKGLNGT